MNRQRAFPPSKLRPYQKAPLINPSTVAALARASPVSDLPVAFDWRNQADITKRLGVKGQQFALTVPVDQGGCGNCWACCTATALTDRANINLINEGKPTIGMLSINFLTECGNLCLYPDDPNDDENGCMLGCNGSDLGTSFNFLTKTLSGGMTPNSCNPWVTPPHVSEQDVGTLYPEKQFALYETIERPCQNSLWTKECADTMKQCRACNYVANNDSDFRVFVQKDSVKLLKDPTTIKQEVYLNGPVGAAFQIFQDFQSQSSSNGSFIDPPYQNSDGVYIQNTDDATNPPEGFHAVVIVGWGSKKIQIPGRSGPPIDVPYWIVRNSWGTSWGTGGYWMHAMANPSQNINMESAMEGVFSGHYDGAGGVISFLPEFKGKQQAIKAADNIAAIQNEEKNNSVQRNEAKKRSDGSKSTVPWSIIIIIIAIVIGIIGVFIAMR